MSTDAPEPRFAGAAAWMLGGLLVWAAYFLGVYVFAALACERGFAAARVAGIGVVPFAAGTGFAVALGVTLVLARAARRRLRAQRPRVNAFADFLAFALALAAVLALTWTALPPLLLRTGCA